MKLQVRKALAEDVYRDIARIPEAHRLDVGGRLIPEGTVCRVLAGCRKAFVVLRGKGDCSDAAIWLDERTRNLLNVNLGEEAEFQLKKVRLWGQLRWAWDSADAAYRVAARLAVLSVVLGLLGLGVAVIPAFWSHVR
jgi:hypothetical protein